MSGGFANVLIHLAMIPHSATGSAESIPAQGNAWRISTGDVFGDSAAEIVYACYDGTVCCQSTSPGGEAKWKYESGAFPYDLAVANVDGDEKCEVLVASADGRLTCLGTDGKSRWSFTAGAPLFQVAVVRDGERAMILTGGVDRRLYVLRADGRMERAIAWPKSIRLIRHGDLDGDRRPEVVVADWTAQVRALRWPSCEVIWQRDLRHESSASARHQNWFAHSLVIGDLDGDGPCELIFGRGNETRLSVRALSGDGTLRWEKTDELDSSDGGTMGHTAVALCNLGGPMGRQVAALEGCHLHLIDRTGRTWAKGAAPISFTDLCAADSRNAGSTIYLSSSPNGDDCIYRVQFEKGWERSLASLQREGKMRHVSENLNRIREQVKNYRGSAPAEPRYIQLVGFGSIATAPQLESFRQLIAQYRRVFPYPNCFFAVSLSIDVDEAVPGFLKHDSGGRRPLSSAKLINAIKRCEKADLPFIFTVAHGCQPFISLDLVEKIAGAAPTACLGFASSEDDGSLKEIEHFVADYWLPVMEICKRAGKKAFLVEKHAWWTAVPAMNRFRRMVDGTFRDVLVMSVEDSNSRSPELNLMGRLGLYLSRAAEMSARTMLDEMCWNRQWEWEAPATGHPFLRRQIVQGLLGARYYEYMLPLRSYGAARSAGFSTIGSESAELVIHMLGKGLLIPPAPSEMAGVSPIAIRMREPDDRFVKEAFNIHGHDSFTPDREENDSPFEGLACHRGAAPVRPSYVGGYLLGIERHAGGFIPTTPFGMPAIVPSFVEPHMLPWSKGAWETDGRWWFEGMERRSGVDARPSILKTFEEASSSLPVRLEGEAFMQVQITGPDILRATLIDPGFFEPADRQVTLRMHADMELNNAADLLSGEPLKIENRAIALTVPAGAFRIIELHGNRAVDGPVTGK